MIGDMSQDMAQISAWVDIVEFAGSDERVHRSGALTPAIGSGKEEVFSAKAQFAFILPISGRKLKSTIVGIHCMGITSRFGILSSAAEVR